MPSKLGPYSLTPHSDVARLVDAGCPLVICADYLGQAEKWQAARPDLLVAGKLTDPYDVDAAARSGKAPQAAALDYVRRQQARYRLNPAVKIWLGPQGADFGSPDQPGSMAAMAWYADFEAERLKLLSDQGLRGVAGNFPAGAPELPLWLAFLPALDAAEQFGGYLGLREVSSPWLWWGTGRYQPGAEMDEGDAGLFTLRYRRVYRQCLAPNGFGHVPLLITECGLGRREADKPGWTNGPWLALLDFWRSHDGAADPVDYWRGAEKNAAHYYAEQLIWYDWEMQKDEFVAGAAVAVVGQRDEAWRQFDIAGTEVVACLAEHIRAQRPDLPLAEGAPEAATAYALEASVTVPAPPTLPLALSELNLLGTAGFDKGQADFHGPTRELAVPAGWQLSFHDEAEPLLAGQAAPFGRPLAALINSAAVMPADRERIFRRGGFCWKVSNPRAPLWVRLWQATASLWPGLRYRLAVSLLPDLPRPQGARAADPLASEIRLVLTQPGAPPLDSDWKNSAEVPPGRYSHLTLEFTAAGERAEVAVEIRGRWALPAGAWYINELSLMAV